MKSNYDVVLGRLMIVFGFISGWGIAFYFFFTGEALPLSMLFAPAGVILIGLALIFSDGIERTLEIQDEIEAFPRLVNDDLEELRRGNITPTHAMVAITILSLIGQVASVLLFRKWQANLGGCMNVVVFAVIAGFLFVFVGMRTKWFQQREQRLSWWVYMIPLIALGLSAFLGIYFAEPRIEGVRDLPAYQATDYAYTPTATRINAGDGFGVFDILDGAMSFDCDEDACLVLVLVVIAVACVAAAAFIPHFWVVSTTILWVIMFLITIRELLYVEAVKSEAAS